MKKTFRTVLALIFCFIFFLSSFADALTAAIPANVEIIGDEAFYGDTSLDEVVLPEGITTIGKNAFGYSSLKQINLPSSLTSIDKNAFIGCNLETIECEQGTPVWDWCVDNGYQDILTPWAIHVTSEGVPLGSLHVSWTKVKDADHYVIYYNTIDKEWTEFGNIVTVEVGNVREYALTGLDNGTTYYVWLKAYKNTTELKESDDVSAATAGDNPDPNHDPVPVWEGPEIRNVYSPDRDTLTIEFDEFAGATGYYVFFRDTETDETVTMYVNAEERTHDGLVSTDAWITAMLNDYTTYGITVQAIENGQYISSESTAVYYTTNFSGETGDIEDDITYPNGISLSREEKEMRVGEYYNLTATLSPSDVSAEVNGITWGSYDESVAVVENGEIHAVGTGATAIYACTQNALYAYCQVTVLPDPEVTGCFENNGARMIVKYGYEDQLNYHVEAQYAKLKNVKLVQVNGNNKTTIFTNSHNGQTSADGTFTISAAPGGEFRSLGSVYTFNLVATLSDDTEETLDTATVEIGFGIPKQVENVEASYSSGKIYVSWDNQGDAKRFKVIYIQADDAWATPGYVDINDEDAEEAIIPASAIEAYKTYLVYVVAYPTDDASYASRSDPVRVTTVNSSTPGVSARFVGNQKVYAPGETIQIEITYNNVVKVHYHNGDISYNANSLQTGNNTGDIGVFSSNRSGTQIVELEAQSVSGWYMVEINAKNKNDVQASEFYNYTTNGGVACLGLSYYVDADGLEAPSWRTTRSMTAVTDLLWSSVQSATGYRIWISTTDDMSDAEARDVGNVQQYTLTGLITGRDYCVWVQAVNSNGGGSISSAKRISLTSTAPSVTAVLSSNSISPGGTVRISITYENVMKVHYQNGTGKSGDIWSDDVLQEKATNNISGTETVTLPAQYIPGEYEVTIWAKDTEGKQATVKEGLKLRYTVSGQAPNPSVSLSICPKSTNTVLRGANLEHVIWLTHTYSNASRLVYNLYQGEETKSFTNFYYLNDLGEKSKPYIEFTDDISSNTVTGSMTFIPADELVSGTYTLRVTAYNEFGSNPATAEVEIIIRETDMSLNTVQESILAEAEAWLTTYWDAGGLGIYSSSAIESFYSEGTISHGAPYVGGDGCTPNSGPARRKGVSGNDTVYRYNLSTFRNKCLSDSPTSTYKTIIKDSGRYDYSTKGERFGALNGLECTGFVLACMQAADNSVSIGSTLSGQSNSFSNTTVNVTSSAEAGYADYSFVIPGDAVRHSKHVRLVKENHLVRDSNGSVDIQNSYLIVYECSPSGTCICSACINGNTTASGVRLTKRTYASLASPGLYDDPYSIVTRLKAVNKSFNE